MKRSIIKRIIRIFSIVAILWWLSIGLYILRKLNPQVLDIQKIKEFILSFESSVPQFVALIILFFVFRLLFRIVKASVVKVNSFFLKQTRSKNLLKLVKIVRRFLYILLAISIVFHNIGALITSLWLVWLWLTFALQKPILNSVWWLTITFKDIYSEWDRIKIDGILWDVEQIQLMNTVLHSVLDNADARNHKIVTIPNELILSSSVENYTKGSNYILEELHISITYESDYHKAIEILDKIAKDHLIKIKKHIKTYQQNRETLFQTLDIKKKLFSKTEKKKPQIENRELESLDRITKTFSPKIKAELSDSAILLLVQFVSPYDKIKRNRTDINLAFLDYKKLYL